MDPHENGEPGESPPVGWALTSDRPPGYVDPRPSPRPKDLRRVAIVAAVWAVIGLSAEHRFGWKGYVGVLLAIFVIGRLRRLGRRWRRSRSGKRGSGPGNDP
jgi:hypothetical protein